MRKTTSSGLSFMTVTSIAGVAIGVAALVIVLSVMGGFEEDLGRKMLIGQPHIEVLSSTAGAGFSLKEHGLNELKKYFVGAIDAEPFTEADVVLKRKSYLASATLFGIDPDAGGKLWGFYGAFKEGGTEFLKLDSDLYRNFMAKLSDSDRDLPTIALGFELAKQLGAELGDVITVLSPQANAASGLSGGTVARRYVLAGIFASGLFNFDSKWAVTSLPEGRKFMPEYDQTLDDEEFVTGVGINVAEPMKLPEVEANVLPQPQLSAKTWKLTNKSLLFALKLEKFTMGSILMLIVVVAAFSISGTLMMTVYHKKSQVSLLRSVGMSKKDISRIFAVQGFVIGFVGCLLGLIFGLAICRLIGTFRFIPLPEDIYYLRELPVKFLPLDYCVIAVSACLLSLIAALYPAITAARQEVSQGLRFE